MTQQDYFLRQIENLHISLRLAIEKMLHLDASRDSKEINDILNETLRNEFNTSIESILLLDENEIANFIKNNNNLNAQNIQLIIDALKLTENKSTQKTIGYLYTYLDKNKVPFSFSRANQ